MTRPRAQSLRFAQALGLDCLISPLIAPRFLTPEIPPHRALILTSETGAEAAARLLPPTRAFCVGERTAEAARALGFDATSAAGDAEALIAHVLRQPLSPLLHLRGREARGEIAARLTAAGVATQEAVAYAQEELPLTEEAAEALQTATILPIFSPRTAEILGAEIARIGAKGPFRVVAMSAAVARAAQALDPAATVALRPDADSMVDAVNAALGRPTLP